MFYHRGVLEDPAHDDGIADGQRHGAENRDEADGFADLAVAAQLGALTERADGACAGGTAECELADNAGGADEDNADEIRNQECHAAPKGDHDGEAPDVAHADGGTDAGQNKAPFGFKAVALCGCLFVSHFFPSNKNVGFDCHAAPGSPAQRRPGLLTFFCCELLTFPRWDTARGTRGSGASGGCGPRRYACWGWIRGLHTEP